jgi:Hg(II)-responsive transcriptional regulator
MALTTGQVADEAEVNKDTVLYYEREGLIEEPPRTDSGYRQFSNDVVQRIRFIQEAQLLGFTLTEIQSLLSIREGEDEDCEDARELARDKKQSIQNKIKKLKQMDRTLGELIEQCEQEGTYDHCPIIETLNPGKDRT